MAGLGALVFGFVEPEQAGAWIKEYYDIIKSDECIPIGHAVNANMAMVTPFSSNVRASRQYRPKS